MLSILASCHHCNLQDTIVGPSLPALALHGDEEWHKKDSQSGQTRDHGPFIDAKHLRAAALIHAAALA